ncbi:MAG TPA: cupin domain-containing protein [Halanaerobiales bacterium]|nr:cupin domain-containing protein [Halanaerobiales bacterium]
MNKINLQGKYDLIDEHWDPKIIGEVNNMYVKLAKIKGEFEFHTHQDEDELFYIFKGQITMKYRNSEEIIKEGEMVIVPKGVEHKPYAKEEAHIMLFESKETVNTGDKENEFTKLEEDWI